MSRADARWMLRQLALRAARDAYIALAYVVLNGHARLSRARRS